MKARPVIILVAFAAALVIAGWRFWDFHGQISRTFIQISMKSSVDGIAQLFYDVGGGLSEADSVTEPVIGNRSYHNYRFQLSRLPVYGMRFDPVMSEGSVVIRNVQWMDGLGAILQNISLKQLQSLNQIGSFTVTGQEAKVVTNQKANDPQIGVQLNQPLAIVKTSSLWRHPAVMFKILTEFITVSFIVMILLSCWFAWKNNIASLFQEGKIPAAMLLALIVVVTIEIVQQIKLPEKTFNHEVDGLLYHLPTGYAQAEYVLLGDSVGSQVFQNSPSLHNGKYAMLATNQAVTMTGQYFITRRYLQRSKMPRAVILLIQPFFHQNLDDVFSDNYIKRTFTRFSEILEIFLLKRDPVFTAKMIAYRLLPSFKYRLVLQERWTNFKNADTNTGISYNNEYSKKEKNADGYSLLRIMKISLETENIPRYHFKSLLAMLDHMHIPLFFMAPAIHKENIELHRQYRELCAELFPELKKRYPNFYYFDDAYLLQAECFGTDRIHLSEIGIKIETNRLREKMISIDKLINQ
jgi:hypothetical protein